MNRRRFIQATGITSLAGAAGCLSSFGSSDPKSDSSGSSDDAPDGPSYSFEGEGSFQSDPFTLEEGLAVVDLHNFGNGNFIVNLREAGVNYGGTLVNEIGGFDGTSMPKYSTVEGGEYELYVRDADQWEATVRQPRYSEAEYESIPYETDGVDFDVLGPFEFARGTEVAIDAETDSNIIVSMRTLKGDDIGRVINQIGRQDGGQGSGTIDQSGEGLLFVETIESWSLTVDSP